MPTNQPTTAALAVVESSESVERSALALARLSLALDRRAVRARRSARLARLDSLDLAAVDRVLARRRPGRGDIAATLSLDSLDALRRSTLGRTLSDGSTATRGDARRALGFAVLGALPASALRLPADADHAERSDALPAMALRTARRFAGLDAGDILDRSLDRVAYGIGASLDAALDGSGSGEYGLGMAADALDRPGVAVRRSAYAMRRASRRVASRMATGRGTMPSVADAERVEGSPDWASWHAVYAVERRTGESIGERAFIGLSPAEREGFRVVTLDGSRMFAAPTPRMLSAWRGEPIADALDRLALDADADTRLLVGAALSRLRLSRSKRWRVDWSAVRLDLDLDAPASALRRRVGSALDRARRALDNDRGAPTLALAQHALRRPASSRDALARLARLDRPADGSTLSTWRAWSVERRTLRGAVRLGVPAPARLDARRPVLDLDLDRSTVERALGFSTVPAPTPESVAVRREWSRTVRLALSTLDADADADALDAVRLRLDALADALDLDRSRLPV